MSWLQSWQSRFDKSASTLRQVFQCPSSVPSGWARPTPDRYAISERRCRFIASPTIPSDCRKRGRTRAAYLYPCSRRKRSGWDLQHPGSDPMQFQVSAGRTERCLTGSPFGKSQPRPATTENYLHCPPQVALGRHLAEGFHSTVHRGDAPAERGGIQNIADHCLRTSFPGLPLQTSKSSNGRRHPAFRCDIPQFTATRDLIWQLPTLTGLNTWDPEFL